MFSKKKIKQDKRKKEYACRDEDRNIDNRNYLMFKRKMIIRLKKEKKCMPKIEKIYPVLKKKSN